MMNDQGSISRSTLIKLCQFLIKKESLVLAENCQNGLVATVLYNARNIGLNAQQIVEEIEKEMGEEVPVRFLSRFEVLYKDILK